MMCVVGSFRGLGDKCSSLIEETLRRHLSIKVRVASYCTGPTSRPKSAGDLKTSYARAQAARVPLTSTAASTPGRATANTALTSFSRNSSRESLLSNLSCS